VRTAGSLDGWARPGAGAAPDAVESVRTMFTPALDRLARSWAAFGAGKQPPPGFVLGGAALRLWCIAAVRPWEAGYALALGERDDSCWEPVGAALATAGLPAMLVGVRGGGPAYRIPRGPRLQRLVELVGDPPPGAPDGSWPV
jgi:hypothetical protein